MIITSEECAFIIKKLEYNFKKKGHPLLEKLSKLEDFEISDLERAFLLKKFEYTFKKKGHPILDKLAS